MSRHFNNIMELYIIEDYKDIYPDLKGSMLTDELIKDCFQQYGLERPQVRRTPKGKPYADFCAGTDTPEAERKVHLSVSHSKNIFVCIIAENPVGIDVQHRTRASADKIAARYFTGEEKKYMDEHGEKGFFTLWARKEAYSKLTGKGLEEIMAGASVLNRKDVCFTDLQLEDGVWCSYCMGI